jgi:hypothetical protein
MDPYIEGSVWEDFHTDFMSALRELLIPLVRPRYVVRIEERAYLEHSPGEGREWIRPDVAIAARPTGPLSHESSGGTGTAVAVAAAPVVVTLPIPEREREHFLTIRERESMEVVTVIEVLSPSNKRPGSDGRREYLGKRETVLVGPAHLVELDLLRGGERLPTVEPLPPGDYYAIVSRKLRRPEADVYFWTLRQRLPAIKIPLASYDADVLLDLQAAFATVYDRAGYDYSLDYRYPVEPPLTDEDAVWVQQQLTPLSPADPTE